MTGLYRGRVEKEKMKRVTHVFADAKIYNWGMDWDRVNTHAPSVAYQEEGGRPI